MKKPANHKKYFILALLFAAVIAFAFASVMTLFDWQRNPGEIFRNSSGTNWGIVFETMLSWFGPVFVLAGIVALVATLWRARRGQVQDAS